tara:strand:+ start:4655 stop:5032 length:378 start_codon:yes stop_codon:yes gene_type:complete
VLKVECELHSHDADAPLRGLIIRLSDIDQSYEALMEFTTDQIRTEAKRVIRHFQSYSSDARALHASSHRLGHRKRQSIGEYFYTHPEIPDIAFDQKKKAAIAALTARSAHPALNHEPAEQLTLQI